MTVAEFILNLIVTIQCTNAQSKCSKKPRIFVATEGHALLGHVISTHIVNLYPDCHDLCLKAPRCLSYNFEYKSTSSSHVCEINDATENMCPGSLVSKPGFNYYDEKDSSFTKECPPTAGDEDTDVTKVTFPRKSVQDYIRFDLQGSVPRVTAFTLCMWLNILAATDQYGSLFSYSLPSQTNEILLIDYLSQKNLELSIGGHVISTNIILNDGTWHHLCTTWENAAGSWKLYIDGAHSANEASVKTGHVIDNNGIFILGQDQDSHGGGFQQSQSFYGQMHGVNMWNRVLTAEEILQVSGNCSYGVGNYLRWSDFLTGLHGDVMMTSATCFP